MNHIFQFFPALSLQRTLVFYHVHISIKSTNIGQFAIISLIIQITSSRKLTWLLCCVLLATFISLAYYSSYDSCSSWSYCFVVQCSHSFQINWWIVSYLVIGFLVIFMLVVTLPKLLNEVSPRWITLYLYRRVTCTM